MLQPGALSGLVKRLIPMEGFETQDRLWTSVKDQRRSCLSSLDFAIYFYISGKFSFSNIGNFTPMPTDLFPLVISTRGLALPYRVYHGGALKRVLRGFKYISSAFLVEWAQQHVEWLCVGVLLPKDVWGGGNIRYLMEYLHEKRVTKSAQ